MLMNKYWLQQLLLNVCNCDMFYEKTKLCFMQVWVIWKIALQGWNLTCLGALVRVITVCVLHRLAPLKLVASKLKETAKLRVSDLWTLTFFDTVFPRTFGKQQMTVFFSWNMCIYWPKDLKVAGQTRNMFDMVINWNKKWLQ